MSTSIKMMGELYIKYNFNIINTYINQSIINLYGQVEINLDQMDIIINNIISMGEYEYSDFLINIDGRDYIYIDSSIIDLI